MKVTFIVPRDHDQQGPLSEFAQCKLFPPVSLGRMAGLAGKQAQVAYLDERERSVDQLPQADVAIIFVNNYNRYRAYEIARHYRDNGSTTVFTGPYLSQSPEEACNYVDCVFIGAGDEILPGFLADYRQGKPRRLYASAIRNSTPATVTSIHSALTLSLA